MDIKVNYPEDKEDIEELLRLGSEATSNFIIKNFSREDISKALKILKDRDKKEDTKYSNKEPNVVIIHTIKLRRVVHGKVL